MTPKTKHSLLVITTAVMVLGLLWLCGPTIISGSGPLATLPSPATMTSCTTVRPPNSLLHAPVIVLDACGKGVERTPTFITGDEWAAAFTFDCTAVGGPGVFQANAYSATGAKVGTLEATLANESRTKSKGVVPVHATPGAHYVSVSTACAWTLRITSYN